MSDFNVVQYILRQNIELFTRKLAAEKDSATCEIVRELLSAEKRKLQELRNSRAPEG